MKYQIYGEFGDKLPNEGDHGNLFTKLGRKSGLARYSTKRDESAIASAFFC